MAQLPAAVIERLVGDMEAEALAQQERNAAVARNDWGA